MASSDAWLEFEQIRHNIKNNTVDKLKQILTGLNDECGTHFSKSGKKQEIIDRIVTVFDTWRNSHMEDKWLKAKAIVYQVRNNGTYTPSRFPPIPTTLPPIHNPNSQYSSVTLKSPTYQTNGSSSSSSIARYDPYAPPRKPQVPSTPHASTSASSKALGIRFKDSPFFQIDQLVSPIVECPESTSAIDRRQQTLTFTLNNEQLAKLKQPKSNYQLRLFCTSSIFYTSNGAFRSNVPCPIEFPPTCEVRVNNTQLTANLKGLKKKPGTAPPPDLGKYVRMTGIQNRIEMVYVNSTQPVQAKKFYLVVMLVEMSSVEQLVSNLRLNSRRSSEEIKQKMLESLTDDDDIQAGPQKMSLKCPLSFMRVNTPCRSSKCVHSQCFDATSWFSMMEQTTTYLCPVCERTLDYKDLIIDGYFDDILKKSPESVEDVIVESNGEWHTSDNRYGSAKWKAAHPVASQPLSPQKPLSQTPSRPVVPMNGTDEGKGKAKAENIEILVLDSDDEDEGRVKRELSPSYGPSSSRSFDSTSFPNSTQSQSQRSRAVEQVIDLTLDSDDEASPPLRAGKRKAAEAELHDLPPVEPWKKARSDHDHMLAYRTPNSNDVQPIDHNTQTPPINGYPHLPPVYNNYPNNRHASSGSLHLPPLQNYHARSSSNSRWP